MWGNTTLSKCKGNLFFLTMCQVRGNGLSHGGDYAVVARYLLGREDTISRASECEAHLCSGLSSLLCGLASHYNDREV